MTAFLFFLIETGLAFALVATGHAWSWDLSAAWAALLPLLAAGILFILALDFDVYVTKKGHDLLQILVMTTLVGGLGGVFGAPVTFVATGSWGAALAMLGAGSGLVAATFVGTILAATLADRLSRRHREEGRP